MNNFIPSNPMTGRKITRWTRDAASDINSNQVVHSQDFLASQTPNGLILRLKNRHKPGRPNSFKGDLDIDAHYGIGDEIWAAADDQDVIDNDICAGYWNCVANVPSQHLTDHLNGATNPELKKYQRQDGVNYWPQWPMPDKIATADNPNGRYWQYISFAPILMNICTDQGTTPYYVPAIPSGSLST